MTSKQEIVPQDGPEALLAKIKRHMVELELDPGTLRRGLKFTLGYILTRDINRAELQLVSVEKKIGGIPGFENFRYIFTTNDIDAGGRDLFFARTVKADCLLFPPGAEMTFSYLLSNAVQNEYFQQEIDRRRGKEKVLALFTGPTIKSVWLDDDSRYFELPNNGFFHRRKRVPLVPFQDTKPRGQRRGAIAFNLRGKMSLLDDKQKWEVVNSQFQGYRSVVGTSFWFRDTDNEKTKELFSQNDRGYFSFLVRYETNNGPIFGYIVVSGRIPRSAAKKLADQFMHDIRASHYFAVELEYIGAGAYINKGSMIDQVGSPSSWRHDHFLVSIPELQQQGKKIHAHQKTR